MDYQLYENNDVLLNEDNTSNNSGNSWTMDNNGTTTTTTADLFGWNALKIDEEEETTTTNSSSTSPLLTTNKQDIIMLRKRKISDAEDQNGKVTIKQKAVGEAYKLVKDPLMVVDEKNGSCGGPVKKIIAQKGITKMPHWQVDDYPDLNTDIDSLGNDLVSHPYNVSDTILSINGMTVFKQEAPSPTQNEVTALQQVVARPQHRLSPINSSQHDSDGGGGGGNATVNSTMDDNNSQTMFNNTINQLLSQTALANLHNVIDNNNLSSPGSQDSFTVSSSNYNLIEDCRFQYVLAAATSIATKQNEDTLTYLNQGQSYEVKLKKLGDLSLYRGKLLKSIIRICFYERRLQYMEKEQMLSWQKARPGDRILEVDVPLSYGAYDITQPTNALNLVHFNWDPTKEVGVYVKVNCISTEFTPKKHGGEKGVPFRIQVETYQHQEVAGTTTLGNGNGKRLHAAACQVKVFKLKGADRKHKQDREKIMKRPPAEQEKYQPSYECTVLNDLPNDAVVTPPPVLPVTIANPVESSPPVQNNQLVTRPDNGIVANIGNQALVQSPDGKSFVEHKETSLSKNIIISSRLNQLSQHSSPQDIVQWLTLNRFEKYLDTFERFSGDDMLRMSREDFIQICGDSDGIRLHNALHLKAIAPKLKIYVCRENSAVYNAIFLSSYNNAELLQKLSSMLGVARERVRDIYMEGPHSIHVQLNDDLLRHIKDETMFSLHVMHENNGYILLLKRAIN